MVKTTTTEEPEKKWIAPTPSWIKCNTDGSWNKERDQGGAGWVAQEHTGALLRSHL